MIAKRSFLCDESLHQGFADMSGDTNPMHMDAVYARRTQPGARVAHGIHMTLWALEQAAEVLGTQASISRIRARFSNFAYIPTQAELTMTPRPDGVRLTMESSGATIAMITVTFGACATDPELNTTAAPPPARLCATHPEDLTFEKMACASGACRAPGSSDAFIARFPHLSNRIGARRVRGLATLSTLVGMHCPG